MRCSVVGGGAWGTALADLLARAGHHTTIWAREPDVVVAINEQHENTRFLRGAALDKRLEASNVMDVAIAGAELIVYAAPSHVLREVASAGAGDVAPRAILVVATKGIERDSLAIMTDVIRESVPNRPVVALSGPSFAMEVAQRQPTAVVAASESGDAAAFVQNAFSADSFRVYTSDDIVGVELGGALKNVMAVATGVVEGLGLGFNSRAALITRGLAEMVRLGTAMGARPSTFAGLAGIGDLVLTCTGALSRNRAVGIEIGKGKSLADVLATKETVAEGVVTARGAAALAKRHGVEMPIVDCVQRVLYDGFAARDAIGELMRRELRAEED